MIASGLYVVEWQVNQITPQLGIKLESRENYLIFPLRVDAAFLSQLFGERSPQMGIPRYSRPARS